MSSGAVVFEHIAASDKSYGQIGCHNSASIHNYNINNRIPIYRHKFNSQDFSGANTLQWQAQNQMEKGWKGLAEGYKNKFEVCGRIIKL